MPVLTLVFGIAAIVCLALAVRMLSRPTEETGGRGWRVTLLLAATVIAVLLGAGNALLVQRKSQAKQALKHGRELMQQGRTDEAEREFRRAAELDPKGKDAKEELQRVEEARRQARERAAQGTGEVSPGGGAGGGGGAPPATPSAHPQRRESNVRITRYAIDVTLDLAKHSLAAEARFAVRPKRSTAGTFALALSPKCSIQTILVGGKPARTKRDGEWLEVTPQTGLTSRRDTEVVIEYAGFGGDRILPGGDVISAEGSYLRPESRWCPAIGYLEFRSPVHVTVTVPKGQFAIAAGTLQGQRDVAGGLVAYEWDCPQNAMGVAVAAGPWQRLEGREGSVPITVFLWKKHADRAKSLLAVAQQAVRHFTQLYGEFPYGKLAVAEIPFFPGGYSPSSMVLLGEVLFESASPVKKMFDAIVAHEVAHQWWGNLVVPQGPGCGWLAEGFAEYSSLLYVRRVQGEKAFRRALWDAKQQYHYLNQNPPEEAIIDTDPFNQQGSYMGVVYSKGAYVLHMLRGVVGDKAFFDALKTFLDDHRFSTATIDEFIAECEKQSGQRLKWFFDEWLHRTGTIELVYDWTTQQASDGQWETVVTLDQKSAQPYLMPIELQVVTASGKSADKGRLSGTHDEFRFVTRDQPRDIDIDPRDELLLAVPKRASPGA
jgi:aminopeptidase N